MPLVLDTPLITSVSAYRIDKLTINLENNQHDVLLASLDADDNEVRRHELSLKIFDDFGNIMTPGAWPETNPTGSQMYSLIQQFIFLGLQEQPGENGLGVGTIT